VYLVYSEVCEFVLILVIIVNYITKEGFRVSRYVAVVISVSNIVQFLVSDTAL